MRTARIIVSAVACGCLLAAATPALAASTTTTTNPVSTTTTSVPGTTTTSVPGITTTSVPSTTAVPGTAPQIESAAVTAAETQTAVKWYETVTAGGATFKIQCNSGRVDGLRTETVSDGPAVGYINEILDGPKVYIQGNNLGLLSLMQFTGAAAASQTGRWISISENNQTQAALYLELSSGMTVTSIISQAAMAGNMTMTRSTMRGQPVFKIVGSKSVETSVTETMYVQSQGTPLPVEITTNYSGMNAIMTFNTWGHRPAVTAPAHSVPLNVSWMRTA